MEVRTRGWRFVEKVVGTDLPLHLSFPVVYGIAINREASVASSLERLGTEAWRSWKVLLLRNPND